MVPPTIDMSATHSMLKFLMQLVHDYCQKYNIEYFIIGGTLLGAIRHEDIIPHDDDIDIAILYEDVCKFIANLEELERVSVSIGTIERKIMVDKREFAEGLIKIFIPNLWQRYKSPDGGEDIVIGTPTLDIFIHKRKGDKIILSERNMRLLFPNCHFMKSEVYPLKLVKFGDMQVFAPNDGIPHLKRYYGDDCLTVIKKDVRDTRNPREKFR